ncbi:signal peptidase I [Thiotrichales bacterium HSG1]|nr:signal peptidase I [Thiotrichales bacterium HSG1]
MNATWTWDLATILVSLTFVSGIIWLFDKIFLEPKRLKASQGLGYDSSIAYKDESQIPFIVDLAKSLFPVFLLVLLLRSFLVEPFRIPSGSMMPTLLVGDFILVNKFSYGIRLPVANVKVMEIGRPERGDVVVFRYPENPKIPFIKRVVGLPGDNIEYVNKMLYVNGEPIVQQDDIRYVGVGSGSNMTGSEQRIEYLSDEVIHDILINPKRPEHRTKYNKLTVPDKAYFVLGDNRDNSKDSRFWGTVPEENLIGKAFFIWMNWDWKNGGISWQRLGTTIE